MALLHLVFHFEGVKRKEDSGKHRARPEVQTNRITETSSDECTSRHGSPIHEAPFRSGTILTRIDLFVKLQINLLKQCRGTSDKAVEPYNDGRNNAKSEKYDKNEYERAIPKHEFLKRSRGVWQKRKEYA